MRRDEQKIEDTWDLSSIYKDRNAWEKDLKKIAKDAKNAVKFKGHAAESSDSLFSMLAFIEDAYKRAESVSSYAFLSYAADGSARDAQTMLALAEDAINRLSSALSYFEPELLKADEKEIKKYIKGKKFKPFKTYVERILSEKKHILGENEEKLLSYYAPLSGQFDDAFGDLNDIDMDFGEVRGEKLTHGTFQKFLKDEDRSIRKEAYEKLYDQYEKHQHVIAKLYAGSVKSDIFKAKARGYKSSLERALEPDRIPEKLYRNLIKEIHNAFPILHRFYEVKKRALGVDKLQHYDVYMPLAKSKEGNYPYQKGVEIIRNALRPLGDEYVSTLVEGLTTGRWVDKYENKGKQSGAFSSGGYKGKPYILTNYEDSLISSVFTLIHEGGHSMHSYYSVRNNPFLSYSYTIFEAEVASTFNERLLAEYLLKNESDKEMRKFLISKELDDIVATLFRQTMFAEYELVMHEDAENGIPVTIAHIREVYGKLLREYFGPDVGFEETSDLEALRIPHFYRAFYVYKYASGISAAIALSKRVLSGGEKERNEYLSFLKSGGSRYPLSSLKMAGVDMSTGEAVKMAVEHFKSRLEEFEALLDQ